MDDMDESHAFRHDRHIAMMSFDASSSSADGPSLTSTLSVPSSKIPAIVDSLPLTKWCPSIVDRIRKEYNLAIANFILSLPRRPPPLRDHSACTKVRCIANDTQDLGYKSTHWQDCTECVFSGPDPQDVIDVIEHGRIPLISIKSNGLGGLGIKVVKATPKLNYFAVSHVWSGGLGNPGANTLPDCQIRRLYDIWAAFRDHQRSMRDQLPLVRPDRVSEAYWREEYLKEESQIPECLVWIDTLCIPVDPRYKHLRIQAINSMAQIYASAQSIVILDHELQQLRYQEMSNSTIFAYMLCSAWMSRCWTFQEGALAKDWLVQFADGLCCIDDRFKAESTTRTDASYNLGSQEDHRELLSWYKEMPRPHGQCTFSRDPFSSQSLLLLQIWNNLCTRTTTKREDIVSILAIMLELRPSEILSLPSNRRVLSIFNAMTAVPFSFLYRERPSITNWRDARCWLPSIIEESPIDPGGGIMWRRSLRDNFFIFELSKSGYLSTSRQDQVPQSQLPRFYFLCTLIGLKRCLTLVDRAKNQRIKITLGIAEHFYIPHLEICILIGNNESNDNYLDSRPDSNNGVCLGIRDRQQDFVSLFYICPIKCSVSVLDNPQSGGFNRSEANSEIIVQEVEVLEGIEYVIEHDFKDAVQLRESRLVGVLFVTISKRLLALPLCICCIYWILTILVTATYFTDGYNGQLERSPSTLKYTLVVFAIGIPHVFKTWAYVSEATAAYEALQQIEFDGWYSSLYNKEIEHGSTMVNIHYSPRTTLGLLAAGALCLPLLLAPHVNLDAEIVCLLLFIFTEAGQLVLRWLLELCAHLPARINIQWWIATYHTAQSERIARYYEHFYRPSKLTRFIRHIGVALLRLFIPKRDLSRLSTNIQHQDPLLCQPLAISTPSQIPIASGHDYEPWSNEGIQPFIPSTHRRRFSNSVSCLAINDH
ncbi:hypothetical protein N431DRAFT_176519 [Stipitochalara longipes BDJ]|nr:hypothetical protein N431DRAFT_176519 [Stipitochalara longipes BDJ]